MTPEDMVEAFVVNSVHVRSIYDVLNVKACKDNICDVCVFYCSVNILNRALMGKKREDGAMTTEVADLVELALS